VGTPVRLDLLIVAAAVAGALEAALSGDARMPPWLAAAAVTLFVLPLLGRRRRPFAAPAAVWALGVTLSFADGPLVVGTFVLYAAAMAASFLLGTLRDDRERRLGLAITVCGAFIVMLNDPEHTAADLVLLPIAFAGAWAVGVVQQRRTVQAEVAEERARQAEREREAAARIAAAEERTRIARELHDIVAHTVSVMVLQVGAVRRRLPAAHAEDADALRDVERTGRTALAEMRRLLGALRREDEDPELAPQPGLDRLDELLEAVRRAGLPVRLDVDGEPYPLPGALDLSAYRIVQEGLTNALRHARATEAQVVIGYGADEVRISVRDDGDGPAAGDGHGLAGVRERVKVYGGEMTASAANGGGFLLSTRLPLSSGGGR
jgi:signal transduction histidine kinase